MNDGRYVVCLGDSVLLRGWTFIDIEQLSTRDPEMPELTVWRFSSRAAAEGAMNSYGGAVRESLTVEDLHDPDASDDFPASPLATQIEMVF